MCYTTYTETGILVLVLENINKFLAFSVVSLLALHNFGNS